MSTERRGIPLPEQALNALAMLQAQAPEGCPYVFMDRDRWEYYRPAALAKTWKPGRPLLNNVLRKFKTLCKRAGVGKFTIHDLRRSCITNWPRKRPIQVTQQYAGHSDINTTKEYYLSVRDADAKTARREHKKLLGELKGGDPTDPKLTPKAQQTRVPRAQAVQAARGRR
jgi:integrase